MAGNFIKKGLQFFNLGMDEDYEDDYDYLDEDDYDDEPRKPIFKKKEVEEDYDDIPIDKSTRKQKNVKTIQKITPMRQSKKQVNDMELCVIKPSSFEEDGKYITDTLLSNCTVVLNLEGIDVELAQRIVDFASGTCYAINGNFRAISKSIILITPPNVDISGDFIDQVNGSLNISSIEI